MNSRFSEDVFGYSSTFWIIVGLLYKEQAQLPAQPAAVSGFLSQESGAFFSPWLTGRGI
jgi:hypothetical protein